MMIDIQILGDSIIIQATLDGMSGPHPLSFENLPYGAVTTKVDSTVTTPVPTIAQLE